MLPSISDARSFLFPAGAYFYPGVRMSVVALYLTLRLRHRAIGLVETFTVTKMTDYNSCYLECFFNNTVALRLIILCILVLMCSRCSSSSLHIQLDDQNKFVLQSNTSTWNSNTTVAFWYGTNNVRLATLDQEDSVGRVVYGSPIKFFNQTTSKVFSFTTFFSFQIITRDDETCGDGFAFFIAPHMTVPDNSYGGTLGVSALDGAADPARHLLALEFDTFRNALNDDPSNSHIGIDVNGLISSAIYNTNDSSSDLNLYKNNTIHTWLQYDGEKNAIQVWASILPEQPPSPILNYSVDLSDVFLDSMYVGLSAATGVDTQTVSVFAWNFTIFGGSIAAINSSKKDNTSVNSINTPNKHNASINAINTPNKHSTVIVLVTVIPIAAVAIIVVAIIIILCRRHKSILLLQTGATPAKATLPTISGVRRYSYRELKTATLGFSEQQEIAEGGFSVVYKATLPDGSVMAVKKLKEGVRKEAEFAAEVQIISRIRHRNLMKLQGWCHERGEAILVYEFMARGSLESYIFKDKRLAAGHQILDAEKRLEILLGVAAALEYLHEGLAGDRVLHRDVKAANVMLTDDWEAKLGDFGLVKFVKHGKQSGGVTMTNAAGTPGYMAPELLFTGKANDKADVFSFGMLALEVSCGRRCVDASLPPPEMSIVNWVWLLHQSGQILKALESSMQLSEADVDQMMRHKWRCVLHVGLLCCLPSAEPRPSMRQVRHALQEGVLLTLPKTWPHLPFSVGSDDTSASHSSVSSGSGVSLGFSGGSSGDHSGASTRYGRGTGTLSGGMRTSSFSVLSAR